MGCKKIFLDTNILLDFLNQNRANHKSVCKLFHYLKFNDYSIVICKDTITNIFYIEQNKKNVLNFFNDFLLNGWTISNFGRSVIKNAIEMSLEQNLDLEDTLQCLCAKENRCEILITDGNNFYSCCAEIYSTKDFLDKYESTNNIR